MGFLVIYDSVFPGENVFLRMLSDPNFDPYIIVVPDVCRGEEYQDRTFRNTLENLRARYGERVLSALNEKNEWVDLSGEYDIVMPMNPYAEMTHLFYQISYLAIRGTPVAAVRYFTDNGSVYSETYNSLPELSYLWRFYAENPQDSREIQSRHRMVTAVPVGIPKFDSYANTVSRENGRMQIIIAPHHAMDPIGPNHYCISNFPRYAKFFLDLPRRYPAIDWIFRPHPLTLRTMVLSGRWTQAECDEYLRKMQSYPNVKYEAGGSYFESFAASSGLIQDCCSFLPEYFYTHKPQCFILRDENAEREQFVEGGREMLAHTYKAYSEQDIINFIERVVIAGKDPMREAREQFAKEKQMFNYPHACEAIVADIKRALKRE